MHSHSTSLSVNNESIDVHFEFWTTFKNVTITHHIPPSVVKSTHFCLKKSMLCTINLMQETLEIDVKRITIKNIHAGIVYENDLELWNKPTA